MLCLLAVRVGRCVCHTGGRCIADGQHLCVFFCACAAQQCTPPLTPSSLQLAAAFDSRDVVVKEYGMKPAELLVLIPCGMWLVFYTRWGLGLAPGWPRRAGKVAPAGQVLVPLNFLYVHMACPAPMLPASPAAQTRGSEPAATDTSG